MTEPTPRPDTRWVDATVVASAFAAFFGGALSSVQSRANGELSRLASPLIAAVWSFGSGWLLLCLAMLAAAPMRAALARVRLGMRERTLPRWQLVGGLIGGCFVAAQAYAVPRLGVALFMVAVVGGQTANALLVDRLGLGPGGPRPISRARLGAAVIAFAGIALAASARGGKSSASLDLLPLVAVVLSGAGLAVQGAMNGQVNAVGRNALATSWINFGWGTGLLLGLCGLNALRGDLSVTLATTPPWWALIGGILGVAFVAIATAVIGRLGVLVMTLLALTGQLVSAVALDLVSPTAGTRINPQLYVGVAVTLVGAAIAALSTNRRTQPSAG